MLPITELIELTSDGVLDLNTRVDLNEVVSSHLVNQELGGTGVPIPYTLRELDSVGQDRLPDFFR